VPDKVRGLLVKELEIIALKKIPQVFPDHPRNRPLGTGAEGILCQGRGSAANSAVCLCLGITSVDPAEQALLFERFISSTATSRPISTSISNMSGARR
jgi:error-prone DNA polymerase